MYSHIHKYRTLIYYLFGDVDSHNHNQTHTDFSSIVCTSFLCVKLVMNEAMFLLDFD